MSHGWYYNDDFALLMNASHRSLGWNYLKSPINDHLLPGERLEFWLLRHTAPLNYSLTIAVRLVLQGIGTWLLLQVLAVLVGRRRRVLILTMLYALCPLVLTNALWLTVALSLLPAQALVLVALLSHIRYTATGQVRWATLSGLCLLGSALFWEKAAVATVLLPILSLGYLYDGSLRQRLSALVRQWRGWLAAATPLALFGVYFISQGYGGATKPVPASDIGRVLWMQWSRVVAPSIFGGPWRWFNFPGVSLGYASVPSLIVVLTQIGFACVAVLGIRLVGAKSLVAWLFPALPLVIGTTVITLGRFQAFGELIATTLRYGADLAVPLFLGVALALIPTSAEAIRARAISPRWIDSQDSQLGLIQAVGRRRRIPSLARALPVSSLLGVAWLLGSAISVIHFDQHWASNPTHRYVRTLTASIKDAGPSLNLYDTTVSQSVLPVFFGPRWHMADFLPLTGHVPALDAAGTEPLLADDTGHLVPAVLVPAVTRGPPAGGLCTYLVQGVGTWHIPFDKPAPYGDGFLRVDYLQPRPSTERIWVVDVEGGIHAPIGGSRVVFDTQLSWVTLRLPLTSVASVIVQASQPDTHLCIGHLTVGAPFPIGSS